MEHAKSLLNRLMGVNRDKIHSYDIDTVIINEDICVYAIADFCPFQLLSNTKITLGKCGYSNHEDFLISKAKSTKRMDIFKKELFYVLNEILYLLEQKIHKNQQQLIEAPVSNKKYFKNEEQLILLETRYNDIVSTLHSQAISGHVKEAYNISYKAENLKKELDKYLDRESGKNIKNAIVCNVCSLTVFNDVEYLVKHNQGKLHRIITKFREKVLEFIENKKIEELLKHEEIDEIKKKHRLNKHNIHKCKSNINVN
ncbi:LUC7 U1 snRNP component [Spraguea lophii 42_110]|uniref:LUC7 U1 snRNP component n=1 Tax=Spraguea lophii (strain 42_110) TaxID=1358809 RepID=S7XPQ1_SPRLO|nr:LUC7 U1 snRNP component [Spraguea lophii 42_110]